MNWRSKVRSFPPREFVWTVPLLLQVGHLPRQLLPNIFYTHPTHEKRVEKLEQYIEQVLKVQTLRL